LHWWKLLKTITHVSRVHLPIPAPLKLEQLRAHLPPRARDFGRVGFGRSEAEALRTSDFAGSESRMSAGSFRRQPSAVARARSAAAAAAQTQLLALPLDRAPLWQPE